MRYSSGQPLYSLVVHEDAEADLEALYDLDEDAAADIDVFLDEARFNQDTLDHLTRHNYVHYGEPEYDVKEIAKTKRASVKFNLWRVRLLWLGGHASEYRIVYAFHPIQNRYYVLAILPRKTAYEFNNERNQKILAVYDELGIPHL